jgi:1-deoxy-D-xylulose-5-phosphate reductoisomerase
MKRIAILGSTGSIGESALDVVRSSGGDLQVAALCAGTNTDRLAEQVREFAPELAVVADPSREEALEHALRGQSVKIASGDEGVIEAATLDSVEVVLTAVVGAAGILPAYHALEAGKDLALANKETLVAAGEVIMDVARRKNRRILPVDSEHSALFQALEGHDRKEVEAIYLTASGGPFWSDTERDLWGVSPADALRHPSWSMGSKITIDSATLMNKGLEVIEARWLFDVELEKVGVFVHPQSIVHGLVEFIDGSMMAHLSRPDMRLPIAAALYHPQRRELPWERLDLASVGKLEFHAPDDERFPALGLARRAQAAGGTAPAVLNAANEVAVESFLGGRIFFPEIVWVTETVLNGSAKSDGPVTIGKILEADGRARREAKEVIRNLGSTRES